MQQKFLNLFKTFRLVVKSFRKCHHRNHLKFVARNSQLVRAVVDSNNCHRFRLKIFLLLHFNANGENMSLCHFLCVCFQVALPQKPTIDSRQETLLEPQEATTRNVLSALKGCMKVFFPDTHKRSLKIFL